MDERNMDDIVHKMKAEGHFLASWILLSSCRKATRRHTEALVGGGRHVGNMEIGRLV